MPIELTFITSTSDSSKNEGNTIPPWYGFVDTFSEWYSSSNAFDFLYWYNLITSPTKNTMFIQYGQNKSGWGSGRFFIQELEILSQTEKSDGSIDVIIRSRLEQFQQRKTSTVSSGFKVKYTLKVFGNTVFTYTGNSMDKINRGSGNWYTQTFNVKPQQTVEGSGLNFIVEYPDGESQTSSVFMGFGLYNPNIPTYKPMAIRKGGFWKDLNSNPVSHIKIRKGGTWIDKTDENASTSGGVNQGKNRIRIAGNWRQLRKMKGGNV